LAVKKGNDIEIKVEVLELPCVKCGTVKTLGKFWKSESRINFNGYMHICNDCANVLFDEIYRVRRYFGEDFEVNGDTIVFDDVTEEIMKETCRYLDLCFSYKSYTSLKSHIESGKISGRKTNMIMGIYKSKLSSVAKNNEKNNIQFGTTYEFSDELISHKEKTVKEEENKRALEKEYSEVWKGTYTKEDLDYLDNYLIDLNADFKIITKSHMDYARKIAKASLAMDKTSEDYLNRQCSEKQYKDIKEIFDTLSKSAKFSEDKRGLNDVGLGSYGVIFDKVEAKRWVPQHTPIEKDDYDKIIEYFSVIEKSV